MPNYVNAKVIKLSDHIFGSNIMTQDNTITNIDLHYTEFENGNATEAFAFCQNLKTVVNFPTKNVTNMYAAFAGCAYITNVPSIPNGVLDLNQTYAGCYRLVTAPSIPNSVVNMSGTFKSCNLGLQTAPSIPASVTNMMETFASCANLRNTPIIPNRVENLCNTFYNCINIKSSCNIPTSVTNMSGTFSFCSNLTGNIYILSNKISNAIDCFNMTTNIKNVYIPFNYANGVPSATYNSFTTAGYNTEGSGAYNVYLKDINA